MKQKQGARAKTKPEKVSLGLQPTDLLNALNDAKTEQASRRALAMVKLADSIHTFRKIKVKGESSTAGKILLHRLPPNTSVAAIAMVVFWTLCGLFVNISHTNLNKNTQTSSVENAAFVKVSPEPGFILSEHKNKAQGNLEPLEQVLSAYSESSTTSTSSDALIKELAE